MKNPAFTAGTKDLLFLFFPLILRRFSRFFITVIEKAYLCVIDKGRPQRFYFTLFRLPG